MVKKTADWHSSVTYDLPPHYLLRMLKWYLLRIYRPEIKGKINCLFISKVADVILSFKKLLLISPLDKRS